jgi:hypothetical protein
MPWITKRRNPLEVAVLERGNSFLLCVLPDMASRDCSPDAILALSSLEIAEFSESFGPLRESE